MRKQVGELWNTMPNFAPDCIDPLQIRSTRWNSPPTTFRLLKLFQRIGSAADPSRPICRSPDCGPAIKPPSVESSMSHVKIAITTC
jgi:hypothetical protein